MRKRALLAGLALSLASGLWAIPASPAKAISGVGTYCSVTWSDGRWAFTSDSTGNGDPCAGAIRSGGTGATVKHKGLYSSSGTNNVVARCNSSQSWVVLYTGAGNGPLTAAYDAAKNGAQKYCTFVASPKALPIFDNPFRTASPSGYVHATGFDFARAPYNTLKPSDYGQSGTTATDKMDWLGRRAPSNSINDHDGTDMIVARNTKIYAVAAGKVIMARDYQSPCGPGNPTGSDSKAQKEVAIEHTVYAPNTGYYEKFVSYYAHFSSYLVKAGDTVSKGQQLGSAGSTGCSDTPHLHLGVFRTTNSAARLSEALAFNTATTGPDQHNNGRAYVIDPWGFAAPKGFDPWAWKAYPRGALAINLWNAGQAPSRGGW